MGGIVFRKVRVRVRVRVRVVEHGIPLCVEGSAWPVSSSMSMSMSMAPLRLSSTLFFVIMFLSFMSSPYLVTGYRSALSTISTTRSLSLSHILIHGHSSELPHYKTSPVPDTSTTSSSRLFSSITQSSEQNAPPPLPTVPTATLLISSVNLLKNCVGAGVFSLNSRVSKIVTSPAHYNYVFLMIFGMATWAIYNFFIIGETCRMTESNTFSDAWSKAVSSRSSVLVQFVVTVAPIISCIANTIVLTDVIKLFLRLLKAPIWLLNNRAAIVAMLASIVLFPICTVRDLSALRSVSAVGLAGQAAAMSALAIRLFDGSYQPGGAYYTDLTPTILSSSAVSSTPTLSKWFILASLLSYCFVTHYNVSKAN
jgi:hypothetical protein